ncbi:MAG: hypothetical protein ACI9D0_001722, partial [Bacteroidia bacterium]
MGVNRLTAFDLKISPLGKCIGLSGALWLTPPPLALSRTLI